MKLRLTGETGLTPSKHGLTPRRCFATFATAALFVLCLLSSADAQEPLSPPKVEVKVTAGGASFGLDDSTGHAAVGGAVRIYLSKRLSVEPEFMYMRGGPNDQDYFFTPSVAYDLTDPSGKYVPYLVAGVGVEHHAGKFFGADFDTGQPRVFDTSFTTWTAGVGAGVKIFLTDRLFVAPEARVGREPTVRGTISVGYVLSGRKRK